MSLLKRHSLRRQVVTGSCLLLLPVALAIGWSANRTRLERQSEVRQEAVTVAITAAAYLDEYLKGLDALSSALVRHPSVVAFDAAACDRLFAAVLREQPLLTNVFLSTPEGEVRGTALPGNGRVDAPWLKDAVRTAKPQIGEFGIGPLSGKPIVMMGHPVLDDDGRLLGVLGLTIDLTQLQGVFANIPLPAGSVVTVMDRTNRVLVRSRDAIAYLGKTVGPIEWAGAPRSSLRVDLDGVERLNGDSAVKRAPWILSVGIPITVVRARLLPLFVRNVVIAALLLAGSLVMVLWLASLVTRQVGQLQSAVQRISGGDLSPPSVIRGSTLEFAELQDSFVAMAANLRETRVALDHQVAHERKMNDTLQSLQRQVVRQERLAAVGLLSAGIAHELNNPLQAILGAATLLERQDALSQDAAGEIEFVKAQGMRAREIIRSLSRFSSSQFGPPVALRLADVVSDVLAPRAHDFERAGLVVEVQHTSTCEVYANFTELEQVTLNFILNAKQALEHESFGAGKGRIEIRTFDVGPRVRLEVSDNGPGVSVDDEQKLFQPFFTTRPVGQGTGLGLSVSYGIVHSYGGSIGYFRNAWGGATFFFELPAVDPASATGARSPGDEETMRDGQAVLRRPA